MMSINHDNIISTTFDSHTSLQCPPTRNNLQALQQMYLQSRLPAQQATQMLNVDLDGFDMQLQMLKQNLAGLSPSPFSQTCNRAGDLVSPTTSSNADYFVPLPRNSIATPPMTQRRNRRNNYIHTATAASSSSYDRSVVGLLRVGSPTSVLQDRSLGSVASPASPICSQSPTLASSSLEFNSKYPHQQLLLHHHQHQHHSRQSQHSQPHPQVLSVHASAPKLQQVCSSKQGSDCVNNNINYNNNFGSIDSSLSMLSLGLHMHNTTSSDNYGRINIPSQHDRPGTTNFNHTTSLRVAEDCSIVHNNYPTNLNFTAEDNASSSTLSDIQYSVQLNNVRTKSTDSIQSSAPAFSVQENAVVGGCQQQQQEEQQKQQEQYQQKQQQQQKAQKQQQLQSKQQLPDLWAQFLNPSGNFKYKTEICTAWSETQTCKFGDKCDFAHGVDELKLIDRHPKYKTEVCRTFAQEGYCQYGIRCRFIHKVMVTEQEQCEDASDAPAPISPHPSYQYQHPTDKQTRLSIFQQLADNPQKNSHLLFSNNSSSSSSSFPPASNSSIFCTTS